MEGDLGGSAGGQARDLCGNSEGHGVELGLVVGGAVHRADHGSKGLIRRGDIDGGLVPALELGHQGLGDLGGDLHLLRSGDDGNGHGSGGKAALIDIEGSQGAADGGDDVAACVHVVHHGGQLLQAALGALDGGLQLGKGGVHTRHGALIADLGLVHLQLGGGADIKKGLGVGHIVLGQLHLFGKNGLLVVITLDGAVIADPGGVIIGDDGPQVQRGDLLALFHGVSGVFINGGALGGGAHHNGLLVFGAELAHHRIFRGDGIGGDLHHLHGDTGGLLLLRGGLLLGTAGQAHGHGHGQRKSGQFLLHGVLL